LATGHDILAVAIGRPASDGDTTTAAAGSLSTAPTDFAMKHAAFFRNTNLGRPKSPNRTQFEGAFLDAGAACAQSFLTNGTLVFEASKERADTIAELARKHLHDVCGLVEPVFVRSVPQLATLVASEPFGAFDLSNVYECCATFLASRSAPKVTVPQQSTRGDVEIIGTRGDVVFSFSRKFGASPGSPNALLEKLLAAKTTTRNWNTIVRLVAKHG
jgi:uncharacterized protein (DUF1697 family)